MGPYSLESRHGGRLRRPPYSVANSLCLFSFFINFSCIPAEQLVNASARNASCFIYDIKEKHCGLTVGDQYVFGDKNKFSENKYKIHQLHIFGPVLKISPECMSLLFKLYCLWFFPLCDVTSNVPQPRRICRESCDLIVNGICQNESRALLNIDTGEAHDVLETNVLNCSLYGSGNAGSIPECYQIHGVSGGLLLICLSGVKPLN